MHENEAIKKVKRASADKLIIKFTHNLNPNFVLIDLSIIYNLISIKIRSV